MSDHPSEKAWEIFCRAQGARDVGRAAIAFGLCLEALAADPLFPEALEATGALLIERGDFRLARSFFIRAARLSGAEAHWCAVGNCLRLEERFLEAERVFAAMAQTGLEEPDSFYKFGLLRADQGRLDEAVQLYEQSLARDPAHDWARWDLALAHLADRNYAQGFAGMGTRFKVWNPRDEAAGLPVWTGEPCEHLWVRAEQGLGDSLMFYRFLEACPSKLTVDVPRALYRLFARNMTDRSRIQWREDAENRPEGATRVCSMMDLPHLLGVTEPKGAPYLQALTPFDLPEAEGLKVGVCWEAQTGEHVLSYRQKRKSIGAELALELADIPGVAGYSLQHEGGGIAETLLTKLAFRDMADTAAAIDQVDLVITIDTAVAHLAGALGKACWVLLPYVCDWRWRECVPGTITRSRWYDSVSLLRQPSPGSWAPLLDQVRKGLRETIERRQAA